MLTASNPPVYPASAQEKRYHSFGESGHFTSACSGMIYRDNAALWPIRTRCSIRLPASPFTISCSICVRRMTA